MSEKILGLTATQLATICDFIVTKVSSVSGAPKPPPTECRHVLHQTIEHFLPNVSAYQDCVYIMYRYPSSASSSLEVEFTSLANYQLARRLTAFPDGKNSWDEIIYRAVFDPYAIAAEMRRRHAHNNGPVERVLEAFDLKQVEANMSKTLVFYEIATKRGSKRKRDSEIIHRTGSKTDVKMDKKESSNTGEDTWYGCTLMNKADYNKFVQQPSSIRVSTAQCFEFKQETPPEPIAKLLQEHSTVSPADVRVVGCFQDPIWITYLTGHPCVHNLDRFNLPESERIQLLNTHHLLTEKRRPVSCDLLIHLANYRRSHASPGTGPRNSSAPKDAPTRQGLSLRQEPSPIFTSLALNSHQRSVVESPVPYFELE